MGESSAVLFPSYSFPAPLPLNEESHEDNPIHELSQSVSFGRFMTEDLEWGKWSSFLHKKYVDEAEKYSQPGSVAQKKAFFEAHYKRIADAKKAKAEQEPESVLVLLNTLETLTKDEVKEEESDYETELVSSSEELVLSIEKDDEPERKSGVVLEQEEEEEESVVHDGTERKDNNTEDEDLLKKSSSAEEKEEEIRSTTKNSTVCKFSMEKSTASETLDKGMELVCETELVSSSEELVLSIEKDDVPERESVVVLEQEQDTVVDKPVVADDLEKSGVVLEEQEEEESVVHDEMKGKDDNTEDEELSKKSSSAEEKEEHITKNSTVFRLSMEKSAPLDTPDKVMELVFLQKLSERPETNSSLKRQEEPVRQRFSFLNCLMGKTKTQDQNTTRKKRKTDKKLNKSLLCLCFQT